MSVRRQAVLLFILAFWVRLVIIAALQPYHNLARFELERTAISLANTGVYGNPYAVPTGPTAHVSPGYTLILAGLFRLFGTGTFAEIIKELLASCVSALGCALLPVAAKAMSFDINAGLLAGLIAALLPARPQVQVVGDWEAIYTSVALIALSVLTVALWKQRRLAARNAVLQGFAWGISLLFAGELLTLFFIFLAAGVYWFRGAELRRYSSFAAIEVAMVALCLAPWAIRNEYSLGYPILTRSNPGLELRVSNNDDASSDQTTNLLHGVFYKYHPTFNVSEAKRVLKMGEVAYNRDELAKTEHWIKSHPKRFVELTIGRFKDFWFYPAWATANPHYPRASLVKVAILYGTTILGLSGLIYIWRRNRLSAAVFSLILIVFPLPHYLVHVGLRAEYPVH